MMVIVRAGSSSSGRKQIGAGAGAVVCSTTPILRHCVSQPNLTELIDRDNNEKNEEKGQKTKLCSTTLILRHCVSQPNLTEPLNIDRNKEYGQKQNCAPLPLF